MLCLASWLDYIEWEPKTPFRTWQSYFFSYSHYVSSALTMSKATLQAMAFQMNYILRYKTNKSPDKEQDLQKRITEKLNSLHFSEEIYTFILSFEERDKIETTQENGKFQTIRTFTQIKAEIQGTLEEMIDLKKSLKEQGKQGIQIVPAMKVKKKPYFLLQTNTKKKIPVFSI